MCGMKLVAVAYVVVSLFRDLVALNMRFFRSHKSSHGFLISDTTIRGFRISTT